MFFSFIFLALVKGYDDPSNTPRPVQAQCDKLKNFKDADSAIGYNDMGEYKYNGCVGSERNHVFINYPISNYAFLYCKIVSQITLLSGVTSIGQGAFSHCTNLKSITISARTGSSSLRIENGAFYYCSGIDTVLSLPSFVTSIGEEAFYSSSVKITSIPQGCSLAEGAFKFCNNIESVNYHGGNIGEEAFRYCSKLKTFTLEGDSTIVTISNNAFRNTILEGSLNIPDSLRVISEGAFMFTKISGDLDLNEVSTIGESAFQGCTGLRTLTATNVVSFGNKAFFETEVTGNLVLSEKVALIGEFAFYKTKITGLTISQTASSLNPEIKEHAFAYCSSEFSTISIPTHITIDKYAFAGLTITGDVTIGYSYSSTRSTIKSKAFIDTTIGKSVLLRFTTVNKDAFLNSKMDSLSVICRSSDTDNADIVGYAFANAKIDSTIELKDVQLDDNAFRGLSKLSAPNVTFLHDNSYNAKPKIGNCAFYETTITGVNSLLENISSIGYFAFYHCKNLNGKLTLNVSTINNYAFTYCSYSELTLGCLVSSLTFKTNTDGNIDSYLGFQGCPLKTLVIEPSNDESKTFTIPKRTFYKMSEISNDLFIPSFVSNIGDEAFSGCSAIPGLELEQYPSSLTLSSKAFLGCSKIPKLNITRSISTIPTYAFYQCSNLKDVIFNEDLSEIDSFAFSETGLTSLQFPDSISTINYGAFQNCASLGGNLVIPDNVETINTRAFYGCPFNNGRLTVGKGLETIGDYAFYQCKFTGGLSLPDVTSIGSYAFYECTGFNGPLVLNKEASVNTADTSRPVTVLTIGKNAFQGCTGLTGEIPASFFDELSDNSFYDCKGFSGTLDLQHLNTIPNYAFYNCENLQSLVLSDQLTSIGDYAFYGCTNIEGPIEFPAATTIGKYAFAKCSKLNGPLKFESSLQHIDDYAFSGCSGFSDSLSFEVGNLQIGEGAFKDCSGFNKGTLTFSMAKRGNSEETGNTGNRHFSYPYFLSIQNSAFENAKFNDVYYLGRFEPDCDYDSGIKDMKKIHVASNYVNSSFCRKTVRRNGLSGGAIAGIVIACIVVVAVIVVLVILLIRERKKSDHSEGEVEMNEN